MNNLHAVPAELTEALTALPIVATANYEYPGYWALELTNGLTVALGDANGFWAWDAEANTILNIAEEYLTGETTADTAPAIATAFNTWAVNFTNA